MVTDQSDFSIFIYIIIIIIIFKTCAQDKPIALVIARIDSQVIIKTCAQEKPSPIARIGSQGIIKTCCAQQLIQYNLTFCLLRKRLLMICKMKI